MKTLVCVLLMAALSISSQADEERLAFGRRLIGVLDGKILSISLENANHEEAITTIAFDLRRKFGSDAEVDTTGEFSRFLSKISFTFPFSSGQVTCEGKGLVVKDIINNICRQLGMKLIIDFDGGFIFTSNKVNLDPSKYKVIESIYISNDLIEASK